MGWWAKRKEGEDLISGDLQTLPSPVTFSQAETQEEAGRTSLVFPASSFSTQAFQFELFLTSVRTRSQRTLPLFSLRRAHSHTHKSDAFIHTPRRSLATELPLQ